MGNNKKNKMLTEQLTDTSRFNIPDYLKWDMETIIGKAESYIENEYNLQFLVNDLTFANLRFNRETALVVCRTTDGRIVVGAKPSEYPPEIYRLLGGGIHADETPEKGAIRELKEELDTFVDPQDLIKLATFNIKGVAQHVTYQMKTHVYYANVNIDADKLRAGDDVEGLVFLTDGEFGDLIQRYMAVPEGAMYKKDNWQHSWYDFCQVYGIIHEMIHNELKSRNL